MDCVTQWESGLRNNDGTAIISERTDVSCGKHAIQEFLVFALRLRHRCRDGAKVPPPTEHLRSAPIEDVDRAIPPFGHGSWRNRLHNEGVS